MSLTGGNNVVIGLLLLEHHPHGPDVISSETPVTLRFQVAHDQMSLLSLLDPAATESDFPGHERLTPARALVIEEDPRARKQAVGFSVVDGLPVGVELGASIRAAGMKGSARPLGRDRRAVHLRTRRLV